MLSKVREIPLNHIRDNLKIYFFLFMTFIIGVSAGAFTVNGLSAMQREELTNYFQGFLQLMDNQSIDNVELIKVASFENLKHVLLLWVLGVSIVGIPAIFLAIGIRGFITGFSSGFIIATSGIKGVLFAVFTLFPKEIIIIPCIIALGVNGINFSLAIIRRKSVKHLAKNNLRNNFLSYCGATIICYLLIVIANVLDAYISPVFIRIISEIIPN